MEEKVKQMEEKVKQRRANVTSPKILVYGNGSKCKGTGIWDII